MRVRAAAALTGWLGLLAGSLALFTALGHGPLAPPPLDPAGWAGWATARDPVQVAFALARLLVLGLTWYLLAVTVLGGAARLARAPRLVRLSDAVSVPLVRRVLQASLGLGLATAAFAGVAGHSPAAWGQPEQDERLVLQRLDDGAVEVMRRLPAEAPANLPQRTLPEGTQAPAAERATVWTVSAGDHFWGIAERVLADAWGRAPADREIVPYWREVIAVNQAALADPGNPDLIYPGQTFRLPPAPPQP